MSGGRAEIGHERERRDYGELRLHNSVLPLSFELF